MFRCPHCGEKAFSLRTKLGIVTKFAQMPRCPICKKVAFRSFVVGRGLLYYTLLGLGAFLSFFGVVISSKTNLALDIVLAISSFSVLYLIFNYYFCHFDKSSKNGSDEKIINIQLKEVYNVWPKIRKGEIYELVPIEIRDCFDEDVYTIAMVENIKKGKVKLRVINTPSKEEFMIKEKLIILCKDIQYTAYVI